MVTRLHRVVTRFHRHDNDCRLHRHHDNSHQIHSLHIPKSLPVKNFYQLIVENHSYQIHPRRQQFYSLCRFNFLYKHYLYQLHQLI